MINENAYDIIGIGVSTLDILTVIDEFPATEGVQRAYESLLQGGGPVATAMVASSKLGAKTAMIDRLGDDWRGKLIMEEFIEFGVDTNYINIVKGETSSIASIHVRKKDGKRAIVYSPGSASQQKIEEIPWKAIYSSKILHVNGRHWEECKESCVAAKEKGVKISFDGGAGRYSPELDELMSIVDICIVSHDFAKEWIGDYDVEKLGRKIVKNGSDLAVITMGENGSYINRKNEETFFQNAYKVPNIVDTTGCGDIYHGAFLYSIASAYSLQDAAKIASAASAIKAKHLGGRGYVPNLDEVKKFISISGDK